VLVPERHPSNVGRRVSYCRLFFLMQRQHNLPPPLRVKKRVALSLAIVPNSSPHRTTLAVRARRGPKSSTITRRPAHATCCKNTLLPALRA
jgi:hypothetical protein